MFITTKLGDIGFCLSSRAVSSGRNIPERVAEEPPSPASTPAPIGSVYTGIIDQPRAVCGEFQGQLYLVWGVREVMKHLTGNVRGQFLPKICGVCRNMLAVGPDGDLYPCHRYYGMDKYVMGNIRSGWDLNKLYRYYRKLLDSRKKTCESCWVNSICPGQCPWYLSRVDGSIAEPDNSECDGIRRVYEYLLYAAYKLLNTLNGSQIRKLFRYVGSLR